jgi:spore germination protein YaaH
MQSPLENTNTNQNIWNEDEIKELILYAKHLQQDNEDLQAKMIMMQAKLNNEEAKTKQLNNIIKLIYAKGNNPYNSN